jgi:hypothetical protein
LPTGIAAQTPRSRAINRNHYSSIVQGRCEVTRRYGAYEVNTTYAPVDEDVSPTVYAAKAAFAKAGVTPQHVDVIQLQGTDAGAEADPHGRGGVLR